jgi:hypothetical protein
MMNNRVILSVAEKPSVAKELAKIIGRNDNPQSHQGNKLFIKFILLTIITIITNRIFPI